MRLARSLAAVSAVTALIALAGCGGDPDGSSGDTTITVFAASSLTASFEKLGQEFEASHDGAQVEFNFAGSSDLVAQIQQGAGADVFASADQVTMDKLTAEDLQDSEPAVFASNTLEIVVPPDNPAGIASFQDLATPDLALVVCAPEVPCGAAVVTIEDATGVTLSPVSEEEKVTDVLAKVQTGEADAGLVYVTDVIAAGDAVLGVEFPESAEAVNVYPIATVDGSDHADLAQEFVDLVLSDAGQQVLRVAGFAPAP